MKKHIVLNDQTFYEVNPHTKMGNFIKDLPYQYDDIYKAYDKPSSRKVAIWEWWKRWCEQQNFTIWISSRNSQIFTIGFSGFVGDKNIFGYITPTQNKVVIE